MDRPTREVVITGVGAATPLGIGYEAVRAALASGTSGVRRLSTFDTADFPVRVGAEVVDFDPKEYITPRKSLKVMSRSIQLAFASAQMAVTQAGISSEVADPDRYGVVFGADMIHIQPEELVGAFRQSITGGKFEFSRWDEQALHEMYPLWMLRYLPNMPACHVGIARDARGPNNTIVLAEASSLIAIAEGAAVIERDHADVMIVGGTGSRVHPLSWAFRDNWMHSRRYERPAEISRPFDARRDGMVYGEGAAAFILEDRTFAERRGAKILGRVAGWANSFEACTPGQPFEGRAIRSAIARSLRSAGIGAADVGHVNAHGLSTIEHDRAEALAIRDTLGDVPVTAPKSFFGNLGAGTGAVELLATLAAFESGEIPVTLNYQQPDPACPVNVIHGRAERTNGRAALVLNQTSMGQSVAMVLFPPSS
jgi:3-oxoacyl-[acyl-carrier-protein] synthase II